MATVTPNMKDGKIFSYRFRAYVGRDENNKQIFRTTTWTVPEELVPSKAERAAHKAAAQWKESARAEYKRDLLDPERVKAREIERTRTSFSSFVLNDWFPICIDNGEHKRKQSHFIMIPSKIWLHISAEHHFKK